MSLKIEALLRTVSDYQQFCNSGKPSVIAFSSQQQELSEDDLDLVAAAVKHPIQHVPTAAPKKNAP